ncbi:hypothetical protein ACJ3XI_08410 [Litorimonas sp. RW-G-Af-16]|uniref:hypothetical protein n=1 Tax=Litorimonas sp. RW-G-Af-16 TaxID=3241168 RepID=UPI00390CAACE
MERNLTSVKALLSGVLTFAGLAAATSAYGNVIDRPFFNASSIVIVFGASDFEENGGVAPIVFDFLLLDSAPSGTEGDDLIAADGRSINYNTQRYNPIQSGTGSGWEFQVNDATFGGQFNSTAPHQTLDANDSYNAFGLDATTDIDLLGQGGRASRFYVASNAPFDIFGEASNIQATGDFSSLDYTNIRYRLRYQVTGGGGANAWGQRAQDPGAGGAGVVLGQNNGFTLDDLSAGPVKVFDGGQRTAANRGSIMQQAVSFQSRYNLRGAGTTGNNYDFSQGIGSLSADVTYTIYTP